MIAYAVGAIIVLVLLGKFFTRTLVHLLSLLAVEIVLFIVFPELMVKFAQLVQYFRHLFS